MQKKDKILLILISVFFVIAIIVFVLILLQKDNIILKNSYIEKNNETNADLIINTIEENNTISEKPIVESTLTPLETTYKGYNVAAKITIPRTGIDSYVLDNTSVNAMNLAPCLLYKIGEINKNGNAFIIGHNYENGTLFSNNKYIEIGDIITITAMDGSSRDYAVYDIFTTTAEDVSYLQRSVGENPEITLQTCTNKNDQRLIICAK